MRNGTWRVTGLGGSWVRPTHRRGRPGHTATQLHRTLGTGVGGPLLVSVSLSTPVTNTAPRHHTLTHTEGQTPSPLVGAHRQPGRAGSCPILCPQGPVSALRTSHPRGTIPGATGLCSTVGGWDTLAASPKATWEGGRLGTWTPPGPALRQSFLLSETGEAASGEPLWARTSLVPMDGTGGRAAVRGTCVARVKGRKRTETRREPRVGEHTGSRTTHFGTGRAGSKAEARPRWDWKTKLFICVI